MNTAPPRGALAPLCAMIAPALLLVQLASAQTPVRRGPFTSVQVNIDALGRNIRGDAANEPSIAIDPTDPAKIVIGWRQFDRISSNFRQNGWSYSHDGGRSWTFPGAIQPGVFNSDPVLDTDAQGTFYYLSYPGGRSFRLFKSFDAGLSWSAPLPSPGGDKPWMIVDRTSGIGRGNIYLIWQVAHGPNTFTRSTNGGLSFMTPIAVPLTPTFGNLALAPNGDLYAAGRDGHSNAFVLARSSDARDPARIPTFQTVTVNLGGRISFGTGPNPSGLLGQVQVAVDPTRAGHVYMLCSVNPSGSDPLDVAFARSIDGGRTFAPPVRLNDDPPGTDAWQWFGTLAVAPSGRIDVVWNDTRASGVSNLSETYYTYSLDGGLTFAPNIPISPSWNSHLAFPSQNKIGDYYDMISDTAAANLAYAATFNGEQDVYFMRLGDCNANGIHDGLDLASGASLDANANSIPDECESCQRDLGHGGALVLSVCGDDLRTAGSRATLLLEHGIPSAQLLLLISLAASPTPIPVATGGAIVPDLGTGPALAFDGYATDPSGRLALTLNGGPFNRTALYIQVLMLGPLGLEVSNALVLDMGQD